MADLDTIERKLDSMQTDVTEIKGKIALVDKHEKILYGDPQEAAEGDRGLINKVSGQGRKLDSIQGWVKGAGVLITMAISAFITGAVNLIMNKK